MAASALDSGTLVTALGPHGFRVQGVEATRLPALGGPNLDRLVALLGEAANSFLSEGAPFRGELHAARTAREHVEALLAASHQRKPVLPRLRAELFRAGDEIALYVGDTFTDSPYGWVSAKVSSVVKAQKPEFSRDLATRGFYWRVIVDIDGPVAGVPHTLAFSTTEPRAVLRADFAWLVAAFEVDLPFLDMYCANSVRDWPPIWCLEAGGETPVVSVPFARWLLRGTLHPALASLRPW